MTEWRSDGFGYLVSDDGQIRDHPQWEQAVLSPPAEQEALRRALLQRVADRLGYARALNDGSLDALWPCCWLRYERPTDGLTWLYPLCDQETCTHWHHQAEIWLA